MPEDYVTKSEFGDGLASLKAELKTDMASLKAELKADMTSLETRLKTDIYEATEKVETNLLRAFEKWAVPMNARTRSFEVVAAGLTERVTLIEQRLRDLDIRTGGHPI